MAYFAEVDEDNIVVRVLSVSDTEEHRGEEFLANDLGQDFVQLSWRQALPARFDSGKRASASSIQLRGCWLRV